MKRIYNLQESELMAFHCNWKNGKCQRYAKYWVYTITKVWGQKEYEARCAECKDFQLPVRN